MKTPPTLDSLGRARQMRRSMLYPNGPPQSQIACLREPSILEQILASHNKAQALDLLRTARGCLHISTHTLNRCEAAFELFL